MNQEVNATTQGVRDAASQGVMTLQVKEWMGKETIVSV
jgi:hypothetical protein